MFPSGSSSEGTERWPVVAIGVSGAISETLSKKHRSVRSDMFQRVLIALYDCQAIRVNNPA